MISTSQLVELERYVGNDCRSKVAVGGGPGCLIVQVWVKLHGINYAKGKTFTPEDFHDDEFDVKFDMFKDSCRRYFDALVKSDNLKSFKRL